MIADRLTEMPVMSAVHRFARLLRPSAHKLLPGIGE